jgi:hypothetical protein
MYPGSSYGSSTRANDVDRAAVCAILDNAYADGELDADEHRQRCSWAMSAKTRGQLLGLTSDLQAAPPVFTQQPITTVTNQNRKWIIGAIAGGGLAVVAIVGFVVTWHSGPSASPTAQVRAPTAPAPRPSQTPGNVLSVADVVAEISGDFQEDYGHAPQRIDCPGDLPGRVGASERCSITDNGKHYTADVTVTAINGTRISNRVSLDEAVSQPPQHRP